MPHTPGPWTATGWKNIVVNAPNGTTLCLCPSDSKDCPLETIQANARLIAAAPTLLEYLQRLMGCAELCQDDLEPKTAALVGVIGCYLADNFEEPNCKGV